MSDTWTRAMDDEFLAEPLRRRSQPPPKAPSAPTPIESACSKDKIFSELLKRELGLQDEGSKKRRNSASSEPFTPSLKRARTQSECDRIPRPCTPPNKIIPPYGLFPRHTHPSTPPTPKHICPSTPPTPSQVPSLCGSSIPSTNTTPQKLLWTPQQFDFHKYPVPSSRNYASMKRPKRPRRPLAGHGDAKSEVSRLSLLTWLDGTADETLLEHSDNEDILLGEDQDAIPPSSPQSDEGSPGGSVSDNETWGELSSSEDEGAVLLPQFQQFLQSAVNDLYTHFQEWKKNAGHQTRGERQDNHQSGTRSSFTNTTASSTQPKGGRSNKSPGKRRSGDEDEDRASKLPRLDPSREDQDTRLLACPFAKKNPLQHRKCFKYVLQEIARLKQHLLRVHQVPIHCARCSKVFDTIEERDHHSRQPECIVQPPRIFDGINESQRRQLGKRISSKKSREENWYLIYQILFPDAARPESPCKSYSPSQL
ncbi:uncharacterized protein BDR25DRAFT_98854 [Lindgomyces ingoldianus]|uniref:Uncharacterized protein n=1 Tax=Lindgomyces ingoldianus TaxID=673940 RepID=A0ACB6QDH9_9PLEO|nr:uncharacterized protein BDR25DRAFT_98854 [Lindgomyces ingoldianus]KAF2464182.1 hypothetical protein BDR25DRAFT_98854 [Lindgomyces ingoldianus]